MSTGLAAGEEPKVPLVAEWGGATLVTSDAGIAPIRASITPLAPWEVRVRRSARAEGPRAHLGTNSRLVVVERRRLAIDGALPSW